MVEVHCHVIGLVFFVCALPPVLTVSVCLFLCRTICSHRTSSASSFPLIFLMLFFVSIRPSLYCVRSPPSFIGQRRNWLMDRRISSVFSTCHLSVHGLDLLSVLIESTNKSERVFYL